MSYRHMRVLLFFDLPTYTSADIRKYRKFVKDLKAEGFYMLQESVYVKMALNRQVADSTKKHIKSFIPDNGNIMILCITEKQFSAMDIMLGENKTDVVNDTNRVTLL